MKKILVVDDLAYIRDELRNIFEGQGNEVYEASNGVEALEMYESIKPDLVTMDINMPRMNGLIATKKIVSRDSNAKIIICSSMMVLKSYVKVAKESGALEYVAKPFIASEIISKANKLLK